MIRSPLSDITIPNVSLPRYVFEDAAKYGDRKAFIDSDTGESVTFTELIAQIRRVGSALRRRGVRPGDVILVFSPNSLAYPVILHAANYIGAVLTTCNPLYTVGELLSQLLDSRAKYVFTVPEQTEKMDKALRQYGAIKVKFVVGRHPGYTSFGELLVDDGQQFVEVPLEPSTALCLLPYSSGTTGKSKGVMLTHRNMVAFLEQINHPELNVDTPGGEVMIGFLPFFHGFALGCHLTGAVRHGQTVVIMRKFDLEEYLKAIQRHKATILYMVPPVALLLSKSPLTAVYDTTSVKRVCCGAAPLGREQVEDLSRALGNPAIVQCYGMTETTIISHLPPIRRLRHGSVGVLMSNSDCKILDTTTGELLGTYQDGEIYLRGPSIMAGYLNRPEVTAEAIDQEGWFRTGDIGHVDGDGYFFIMGRVKELIKYKGFQVPPAELEAILLTHPALADAAVIGVPDTEAGELPRAYVVLKPNVKITGSEIADFVAAHVAPHKKLRGGVEFVSEISKSASGKILRRTLKLRASQLSKSKL